MATLGGANIFGVAVRVNMIPHASAEQTNTFFGISGQIAVWGGTRGRVFQIEGVLVAADFATMNSLEAAFEAFNNGIAQTFVDTRGAVWPNVVYRGEYQRASDRPLYGIGTTALIFQPYKLVLHGLT